MTKPSTSPEQHRLIAVELDESTMIRRKPHIDHERRVAIADLLEVNSFRPLVALEKDCDGPYKLTLSMEENRLVFALADKEGDTIGRFTLGLLPFKRIIKEYFIICESYFRAVDTSNLSKVEALDMGRKSIHDEGSELFMTTLSRKAEVDFETARRLFTLVCVLNMRG